MSWSCATQLTIPQHKQSLHNVFISQKLAFEICQMSPGSLVCVTMRTDESATISPHWIITKTGGWHWCDTRIHVVNTDFFGVTELLGDAGPAHRVAVEDSAPQPAAVGAVLSSTRSCGHIDCNGDDDDAERVAKIYVYWHYKEVIRCSQTCNVALQ